MKRIRKKAAAFALAFVLALVPVRSVCATNSTGIESITQSTPSGSKETTVMIKLHAGHELNHDNFSINGVSIGNLSIKYVTESEETYIVISFTIESGSVTEDMVQGLTASSEPVISYSNFKTLSSDGAVKTYTGDIMTVEASDNAKLSSVTITNDTLGTTVYSNTSDDPGTITGTSDTYPLDGVHGASYTVIVTDAIGNTSTDSFTFSKYVTISSSGTYNMQAGATYEVQGAFTVSDDETSYNMGTYYVANDESSVAFTLETAE